MITIRDVAKRAGVSISTVSNALNGMPNVGEETRQRVIDSAKELNYVPNLNAKLMKKRKTNNIGLFLPNFHTTFYTRLVQEMYSACSNAGFAMLVHISDSYTSRRLAATILSSNIDGAVILNENLLDKDVSVLESKKIPYVFLDKPVAGNKLSSVLINNEMGITQGVEYLVHTGHKRIAFLKGMNNFDSVERYQAFQQAMHHFKQPIDPEWMIQGYFEENAAYSAVRGAMSHLASRPDAIFCANDEMAVGCLRALQDLKIAVPEQMSVMGFDDGDAVLRCDPPLTTVRNPTSRIARQSVEELLRLMQPETKGQTFRVKTQLVVRASCAIRFSGDLRKPAGSITDPEENALDDD